MLFVSVFSFQSSRFSVFVSVFLVLRYGCPIKGFWRSGFGDTDAAAAAVVS